MSTNNNQVLVLTADQQKGVETFNEFLLDPNEQFLVIEGYAGCGKSTLVKYLLNEVPAVISAMRLINPNFIDYEIVLTATTNKACEALSSLIEMPVKTIHATLGLRVKTNMATGQTDLQQAKGAKVPRDALVFIDEASFIDPMLEAYINTSLTTCKVVYIGDPAQLTQVRRKDAIVFTRGYPTVSLTKVVRSDKDQIIELATKFRETVNTRKFFDFVPDGKSVIHMNVSDFQDAIINEMNRPDWSYTDSKVLAWTNSLVVRYNEAIRHEVHGNPKLQPGDYVSNNHYVGGNTGNIGIKTDQLVMIKNLTPHTYHDVPGNMVEIVGHGLYFLPDNYKDKDKTLEHLRMIGAYAAYNMVEKTWVDLRAVYACTVNKSQGSTFKKVFIDLDDIKKVNSGNQMARMLYVAVSRASDLVILKGDIV